MPPQRILVVDDDPDILDFAAMGLRMCGYDVLTAPDGEEGVKVAKEQKPDLIVLDLSMPRMHGYQVCKAVREDPTIAATKIVITSGKSYAVDIRTAMEAGANEYLVKPYDMTMLLGAVRKHLT